jgi:hypothetical protein
MKTIKILVKSHEKILSKLSGPPGFPVIPGHLHGDQRRLNCIASRFKRRSSLGSEAPGHDMFDGRNHRITINKWWFHGL